MADNDILINILLDRSGSMAGLINDVIGHYNNFIEEQRAQDGKATVSLVIFDTEYEEVYVNKDINTIEPLTRTTYYARGGTAYYDALGRIINSVDKLRDIPKKVLFVINTDGEENSSYEFNADKLKRLIKSRESKKDWQFLFIGAGIDAMKASAAIGIRNYVGVAQASAASYTYTAQTLGQTVNSYRGGGSTATVDIQDTSYDGNDNS